MCVSFLDPTAVVWAADGHVKKQHVGKNEAIRGKCNLERAETTYSENEPAIHKLGLKGQLFFGWVRNVFSLAIFATQNLAPKWENFCQQPMTPRLKNTLNSLGKWI